MLNVDELERKHKKYKLKSYTPYLAISLGVSAAILSISFFIMYDFGSKQETIREPIAPITQNINEEKESSVVDKSRADSKNEEVYKVVANDDEKQKEEPEVQDAETKERVQLSPSLNFIKKLEAEAPIYKKEAGAKPAPVIEKKVEKPTKNDSVIVKEEVALPVVEEVKESIAIVEKPVIERSASETTSTIDIKRRDDEEDIKHVIKRFNVNHSPALSLFVAKKYYQLGDYEQAYNYSLITNDINNNIEASWLIFSKSLVKLGKKDKAVETLKKYIKHSDSSQARQLLDEIMSGKFK
ncbi:CDC27 family protein [Sulfurimonas sp.]|jgi:tetratricopeptide (TPR) repeat protein|uniref:CDC27 family protein n=1 Tax=Sulfurimonas sp. TaxID=2022749 RepID=UPI002A372476|nr:CDC27 family protein [Sulfurimonas sp.]MDY0123100.1 CDC27 family protein [Sulfurimonas sp.]